MQDVVANIGDSFIGEDSAVMSGARVLDKWVVSGQYMAHGGQTQEGRRYGECEEIYPSCIFPEDLYCDNIPLKRVMSLADVDSGTWFFDYASDSVYMGKSPSGHTLEISVSERAFGGPSIYVTLKNLVIEKYATPSMTGAVEIVYPGDGWIIENCEIRLNHATGVQIAGRNAVVRNNFIHHNFQKGVGIVQGGDSAIIENNEISWNNYLKSYAFGWEGGGVKAVWAGNIILRGNHAHHNYGPGLWTDIGCSNIVFERNLCEYNAAEGIFHELGDKAWIRCNIVRNNATVMGANIQLGNSSNTEVFGNVVEIADGYGDGILVVQNDRVNFTGTSRWYTRNNYIHHNQIIFKGNSGFTGACCEYDCDAFVSNGGNSFDFNTFHTAQIGAARWYWIDEPRNFTGFQELGFEAHGSVDADTGSMDSVEWCMDYAAIKLQKTGLSVYANRDFAANVLYDKLTASININITGDLSHDIVITIYNLRGQSVASVIHTAESGRLCRIPVSRQPVGTYLITMDNMQNGGITKKVAILK
jgi:hypothetical protein